MRPLALGSLACLVLPLLAVGSPVLRKPAKTEPRIVRSLDERIVVLTDREELVAEFFARQHKAGVGILHIPGSWLVLDGQIKSERKDLAAALQRDREDSTAASGTQNARRLGTSIAGWQTGVINSPKSEFAKMLGRELEGRNFASDDYILLVRHTDANTFEIVGFASNAQALEQIPVDSRPQPVILQLEILRKGC